MKTFLFIHTSKFTLIVALIWVAISKYDSTHNPLQQSLWVYMFVYLPAIVGYVEMARKALNKLIEKIKSWANKP